MATKNKFEDMSVLDALKYAKNQNLLLPDIQREYVWNYTEIEGLFESIVDEYPVGSCIMWKTSRKVLNEEKPNLYFFLRDFTQGKSKNEKAPEFFNDEQDYYIVLDGQQRITSLNIALYGSYTSYKGGGADMPGIIRNRGQRVNCTIISIFITAQRRMMRTLKRGLHF